MARTGEDGMTMWLQEIEEERACSRRRRQRLDGM
jgi:hypothetical protein